MQDFTHDNESLDEMLGGRECGAFFRHATEERYRKGNYQLKNVQYLSITDSFPTKPFLFF